MDQITEGGRSIHEIDKIRKRLEAEKLELQAALEEAETALEQEENKVLRAHLELTQVKQEIERRIKEKEHELELLRKTHQKAYESMQSTLETETRTKQEAIRQKKKLEADMNELGIALEHANAANDEAQQTIKKYWSKSNFSVTRLGNSLSRLKENIMVSATSLRKPRTNLRMLTVKDVVPNKISQMSWSNWLIVLSKIRLCSLLRGN